MLIVIRITGDTKEGCDGFDICGLIVDCQGKRVPCCISVDDTIKLVAGRVVHY